MVGLNLGGKDDPTSQSLGGYNCKIISNEQLMSAKQVTAEETTITQTEFEQDEDGEREQKFNYLISCICLAGEGWKIQQS